MNDIDEWVDTLPGYQASTLREMLTTADPITVAAVWLGESSSSDTAPFGAVSRAGSVFLLSVLQQLRTLMCTEQGYEAERKRLNAAYQAGSTAVATAVTAALAPVLGASTILLAPAVVLVLAVVLKAGRESACSLIGDLIAEREA